MSDFRFRRLRNDEWDSVAILIFRSLDDWYQKNLNRPPIKAPASVMRIFPEVYEALDPGCCIVAECESTGRLAGSCFYHVRRTHVSLGIMNVHPEFGGSGVARRILDQIIAIDQAKQLPIRLVSSAMNLDSFSLYTRAGFVPHQTFQDLSLPVPPSGMSAPTPPGIENVRPAMEADAARMAELEFDLTGIFRSSDYEHFIENKAGIWHVSVSESSDGKLNGFLCSVNHPGSNMLGPGVMRDEETAAALIYGELDSAHRGRSPVFLAPTDAAQLVRTAYSWGARNREIHFSQVLGHSPKPKGILMPTFMPETG